MDKPISISSSDAQSTQSTSEGTDTDKNVENVVTFMELKPNNKEIYFYNTINTFFKKLAIEKVRTMIDIMKGTSEISLRMLDWFATKYVKKEKIVFELGNNERFNVFISYKSQLRSYKKKYFDPFRRRKKFVYSIGTLNIITTIGQLNFFKWLFTNDILTFIIKNHKAILGKMVDANKLDKKRKTDKKSSPKKEPKKTPAAITLREYKDNILSFD